MSVESAQCARGGLLSENHVTFWYSAGFSQLEKYSLQVQTVLREQNVEVLAGIVFDAEEPLWQMMRAQTRHRSDKAPRMRLVCTFIAASWFRLFPARTDMYEGSDRGQVPASAPLAY